MVPTGVYSMDPKHLFYFADSFFREFNGINSKLSVNLSDRTAVR